MVLGWKYPSRGGGDHNSTHAMSGSTSPYTMDVVPVPYSACGPMAMPRSSTVYAVRRAIRTVDSTYFLLDIEAKETFSLIITAWKWRLHCISWRVKKQKKNERFT